LVLTLFAVGRTQLAMAYPNYGNSGNYPNSGNYGSSGNYPSYPQGGNMGGNMGSMNMGMNPGGMNMGMNMGMNPGMGMGMGMNMGMNPGGMGNPNLPGLPPFLTQVGVSVGISNGQMPGAWWQPFYAAVPDPQTAMLQAWFMSADLDCSGALSANEVSWINWNGRALSRETAHRLCRLFDSDKNGQIDFNEFVGLFFMINELNASFMMADRDRSYFLEAQEILQAINTLGFNITMPIVQRFCNAWAPFSANHALTWEQFILLGSQLHYIRRNLPILQAMGVPSLDNMIAFSLDIL
jgi:Ca2+-binding EF-hand superfamily protein